MRQQRKLRMNTMQKANSLSEVVAGHKFWAIVIKLSRQGPLSKMERVFNPTVAISRTGSLCSVRCPISKTVRLTKCSDVAAKTTSHKTKPNFLTWNVWTIMTKMNLETLTVVVVTVNQYIFQPANHSPVFTQSTNHNPLPALLWLVHSNIKPSHWSTPESEHPATPGWTSCFHSYWSIKNRFCFPFNQSPSNWNHRCQVTALNKPTSPFSSTPLPLANSDLTRPPPYSPNDWSRRVVTGTPPSQRPAADERRRSSRQLRRLSSYDDPLVTTT